MMDPPIASTSSACTNQSPLSPAVAVSATVASTSAAAYPILLSNCPAALSGPSTSRVEATPLHSQRPQHQSTPLQATAVQTADADTATIIENSQVKTKHLVVFNLVPGDY